MTDPDLPFDLDAEVVRLITGKLIELPTYPGIALQLQRLISNEKYDLEALVRLVEGDPALATHVLRAANSAFFRAPSPITTLPQAISRIGATELSNIAIAGTLGLQASLEGPLATMRRESWRRSLAGALVSQELARSRQVDPGEAFLAGLLHDFGETIAYRTFEVILARYPHAKPQKAAHWQWHAQRYHVELGMALAADWKLPEYLIETVMRHHDGDTSFCAHPKVVELVALTDELTTRLFDAPTLEAAKLPEVSKLTTAEREAVQRLLPRLPSLLQSLDFSAPSTSVESAVTPAPPVVPEQAPAMALEVALVKKDHREVYRGVRITDTALLIQGQTEQPERHLVNLVINRVTFSATVLSCIVSDDGCLIELKPFALSGDAAALWKQLVRSSEKSAA